MRNWLLPVVSTAVPALIVWFTENVMVATATVEHVLLWNTTRIVTSTSAALKKDILRVVMNVKRCLAQRSFNSVTIPFGCIICQC
jgi:hypothetical protein